MSQEISLKWDAKYEKSTSEDVFPCDVLKENTHLLPENGLALDYAAGLGGNAILLAQCKLTSHAWDVSRVALNKLRELSRDLGLEIITEVRDVEKNPPEVERFDVIVASYFLHRPTFDHLIKALRPGGLLFYQTFTQEKVVEQGPTNPNFLLLKNELLSLCAALEILIYREEGIQGDVSKGWRNQAMLVARKPI